jgi:uncharacterized membrane protein YccC
MTMTRTQLRSDLSAIRDMAARLLQALDETPPPSPQPPPDEPSLRGLVAGGAAFQGRPVAAQSAGRCGVCGGGYSVGDHIVQRDEAPRTAHLGCGSAAPRSHR